MEKNLTTGSVFKNIAYFSLPYLLSYFLQTLYGMADLFIIGRYEGAASITAVSVGSQIMHMLTVMIVGLSMGTTVAVGRAVGAKNREEISKNIGNTVLLFGILSLVLTALLLLCNRGIVSLVSTPQRAVEGTVGYLRVCFLGLPFIIAYNIIASIYRGLGDSKSPMYFIAVACAANIVLDYIFMGYFRMGPVGAALGTTLAQGISVIIALVFIFKKRSGISLQKRHLKPDRQIIGQLIRIGLPVAFQDGFIQISFLVITVIANLRGLTDAAAVGIVEKIMCFMFLVPSSMLSAVSALCAQNFGAKKPKRASLVLKYAIFTATGIGLAAAVAVFLFARGIVGLFTSDLAAVTAGAQYLRGYVWDSCLGGIQFCFSGYFCACGRSELSFMHNIASILLVRIPGAFLASKFFADTLLPMGLASSAGSFVSAVICLVAFLIITKNGADPTLKIKKAEFWQKN